MINPFQVETLSPDSPFCDRQEQLARLASCARGGDRRDETPEPISAVDNHSLIRYMKQNMEERMPAVASRVRQYRERLRSEGLRPVQIWVPDVRNPEFVDECRRQSRLVAQADMQDQDLQHFLDQSLDDVEGWTA